MGFDLYPDQQICCQGADLDVKFCSITCYTSRRGAVPDPCSASEETCSRLVILGCPMTVVDHLIARFHDQSKGLVILPFNTFN